MAWRAREFGCALAPQWGMISIERIWELFRRAQHDRNADAALCFRHAIEAYNRCDYPSVTFWCEQAKECDFTLA